jgi:hypothetical protein
MFGFWLPYGLGKKILYPEVMAVCKTWQQDVFDPIEEMCSGYLKEAGFVEDNDM